METARGSMAMGEALIYEWEQWPLRFELHGNDLELQRRASEVLRHWKLPSTAGAAPAKTVRMSAERIAEGYRLTCDNVEESVVYSNASVVLRAVEMSAALALLEQYDEVVTVHAGLLARNDHGVIIVGPSESGKSTLSCALWHAGWQLLADDVAILDCGYSTATPLLRRVSLREPSKALLGDDFWNRMVATPSCDKTSEGYVFHPDELTEQSRARSTPLNAIIFLARHGAPGLAPASASRIDSARALLALATYTNCLQHTDMGGAMRRLGPLLSSVPAYDLARGPLSDMIAKIEQLVA